MRTALSLLLERVSGRYWVLPTAIAVSVVLLLPLIQHIPTEMLRSSYFSLIMFDASADGARQLLSAVASAVMTVVGVLFSITVVVLQQASEQYSPRVIETFTRSMTSQTVLGFYIGTFTYCLLLVRRIRDGGGGLQRLVPEPAISLAILLAVVCLGLLIRYIHHIVEAIQSTSIIRDITEETIRAIRNLKRDFDDHRSNLDPAERGPDAIYLHQTTIQAPRTGYLQAHRWDRLNATLSRCTWEMEVRIRPGDYIDEEDSPIATVRASLPLSNQVIRKLTSGFEIGKRRTHSQDPRFGVRQLVDIALRSLSPGINDPTTALEALNGISSVLLAWTRQHPLPEAIRIGNQGVLKTRTLPYEDLLSLAFLQIIHFSEDHPPVRARILEILKSCGGATRDPAKLRAIQAMSSRLRAIEGRAQIAR